MEIYALLALMATHFLALIVPGPDIFLILRTSLAYGFRQSIFACLGVGAGIIIWIMLTAFGLKTLFVLFPPLQIALMLFSVCYLFYLSFLLYRSSKNSSNVNVKENKDKNLSAKHFFIVGFLTNLSNPKAILYFASIFSRFIDKSGNVYHIILLVAVISIQSVLSFILLGKLFSLPKAREAFLKKQRLLDGICSLVFAVFATIIFYELVLEILNALKG
ncbi:LysE family transporter [Campylobacter sp. RM9344]|uniref:LysE family transporter n=1 Tax=Campylobacter californiensis TaxID=1032243 RepID=A0AAW3ZXE2_9BACT|nr:MULTISPECIES: LysE family transporter [unclassified Campylobacter]MBE2984318.1 LysE family transporter [Campylobacter sp. RM6883]MBE2985928.1 LysE family transporter [Campylobacter sp. RM12919]MBE2988129.1 LysE family transporter [Campylobacter sp. RM12920]MBE2994815.1 LysE family transporter [Campylobacter sp. RM6913]MBE3029409.1 LysE family transporter [Campylobacter sp. RM9344]